MNREKITEKLKRELHSEITVFLALITMLIASLILTSVEFLRTQAVRTYLTTAANSAVDSFFSQYHLELWEEYRLLGLEEYTREEVKSEYKAFLKPYLNPEDTFNYYGLSEEEDAVTVNSYKLLTDDNGEVFEDQVRSYMLYGWSMDVAGLTEVQKEMTSLESAQTTGETASELQKSSRKAMNLQDKLSDISEAVKEHNALKHEMEDALSSGNGTRVSALLTKLRRELSELERAIDTEQRSAAELSTEIDSTRSELCAKKLEGKINDADYSALESQLDSFDSYTEENGETNRALEELRQQINENSLCLDETEQLAEEAEEYIRDWVPDQILVGYRKPEKEGEKPIPIYEDEVLDEAAVWEEARNSFESYEELHFTVEVGEGDREKAGVLESLSNLLTGNLLNLVLPEADKISKKEKDLTAAPSKQYSESDTNLFNDEGYLLNKVAVDEYAMLELSNLEADENSLSEAELEYVLWGRTSDYQNVSDVAAELIAVRTGLNLMYLLKDAESMKEAGTLAVQITGASGPLTVVVTFLVISVWAGGQAVLDVRELFDGGKVPLIHTKKTFSLTLEGMMNGFTEQVQTKGKEKKNDTGLSYGGYLRILLFSRSGSQTDYRIMDVIQENLRETQSDFRMDRLITEMDLTVTEKTKHVFWSRDGSLFGEKYPISVNTFYSY